MVNKCCSGKNLKEENVYFNGEDRHSLYCLECGSFKTTISGTLDEEELNALREGEE